MNQHPPEWKLPSNLAQIVAAEEIWEDEDRWKPIVLSVLGGTVYGGRPIPLAWQIEFEPPDGSDGYASCDAVTEQVAKRDPSAAKDLHVGDTEEPACVIWVESEDVCKVVVDAAWRLIHHEP